MDEELFELCKEVYRRTKWDEKKDYLFIEDSFHSSHPEWDEIEVAHHDMSGNGTPLYTSDYLLEKLPLLIERYGRFELTPMMRNTRWSAGYWTDNRLETLSAVNYTPLKALLRLVIMLNNKGIKYER